MVSPSTPVTATGTPLGATHPTGGPKARVVAGPNVDGGVAPDVVVEDSKVGSADDVVVISALETAHADVSNARVKKRGTWRIALQLWHGFSPTWLNLWIMFGPLNGVRTALVAAATLAALVSWAAGYPGAAAVLAVGVAIHGIGWLYLYVSRQQTD